jgi:hypothetical protein
LRNPGDIVLGLLLFENSVLQILSFLPSLTHGDLRNLLLEHPCVLVQVGLSLLLNDSHISLSSEGLNNVFKFMRPLLKHFEVLKELLSLLLHLVPLHLDLHLLRLQLYFNLTVVR